MRQTFSEVVSSGVISVRRTVRELTLDKVTLTLGVAAGVGRGGSVAGHCRGWL